MEKVLEDVDSNIVYWSNRWDEQKTGWHQNQVDPYLLKHYTTVTGKALPAEPLPAGSEEFKENSTRTWFIPLSGKTLDIPFLLKLGYKVFGVEAVQKAIETLDQENGFGLSYDEKTSLYTGVEGRLQIYCGDLFQCPIENFGPFEYVWDRGSLVALEYPLRNNYKIMMQRAMKGRDGKYWSFKYLLEGLRYDKDAFGEELTGPPRSLSEEDVVELFGGWSNNQFLERQELPPTDRIAQQVKKGTVDVVVYLFTPKSE